MGFLKTLVSMPGEKLLLATYEKEADRIRGVPTRGILQEVESSSSLVCCPIYVMGLECD